MNTTGKRTALALALTGMVAAGFAGTGTAKASMIVDGSFEDTSGSGTISEKNRSSELGTHDFYGSKWGNEDILNKWVKLKDRTWIMKSGSNRHNDPTF